MLIRFGLLILALSPVCFGASLVSTIFDYQQFCSSIGGRLDQKLLNNYMYSVYQLDGVAVEIYSDDTFSGQIKDMNFVEETAAYQRFRRKMGIDGNDGRGGLERNIVNVGDEFDCRTNDEDNAWAHTWVGRINSNNFQFSYNAFYPVGMRDPVSIGHEAYHTFISANAQLEYEFQSGALNEALADAFGVSFQIWLNAGTPDDMTILAPSRSDWQLGADYVMRDLGDPNAADQPDHMSQYQKMSSADDHGGVHINSGIINHAFYLLAEGGMHRRRGAGPSIEGVGVYKALTIWHNGGKLMGPYTNFEQAREKFQLAAAEIYGYESKELMATVAALDAVGIMSVPLPMAPTLPVVTPTAVAIEVVDISPITVDVEPPEIIESTVVIPSISQSEVTESTPSNKLYFIALFSVLGLVLVFFARRQPFDEFDGGEASALAFNSNDLSAQVKKTSITSENKDSLKLHINGKKLYLDALCLSSRQGYVFGRSNDLTDVQLRDAQVSRQHFRLSTAFDGHLKIFDLHSASGTNVNGARLKPMVGSLLLQGDEITVPGFVIKIMT